MSSTLGITVTPVTTIKEKIGLFANRNAPVSLSGILTLTFDTASNTQGWNFSGCDGLTTVTFTNLTTISGGGAFIKFANTPTLANFSFPVFLPPNGCIINLGGNALTAASVNHVLARGVANAAFVSGTVTLNGGTNAAPSGQGIIDKATLIGRGVTVTTN